LEGNRKSTDDLRLFWGGIMNNMLLLDIPLDKDHLSLYVFSGLRKGLEWRLQHFKYEVLSRIQEMLPRLTDGSAEALELADLKILNHVPKLIAQYPELRPLADLYKIDVLAGDVRYASRSPECVLFAQEKLLHRVRILEEVLSVDLHDRLEKAIGMFESTGGCSSEATKSLN
jgi:hypothetical protein